MKIFVILMMHALLAGCASFTRHAPAVRVFSDHPDLRHCWSRRSSDEGGCRSREAQDDLWACARTLPGDRPRTVEAADAEKERMVSCMENKGWDLLVIVRSR